MCNDATAYALAQIAAGMREAAQEKSRIIRPN